MAVPGMGPHRITNYGDEIVAIVRTRASE
jgi:hypothetical protein